MQNLFFCLAFALTELKYGKIPKNSDTRKFAVITLKDEQGGFIQRMQKELQTE